MQEVLTHRQLQLSLEIFKESRGHFQLCLCRQKNNLIHRKSAICSRVVAMEAGIFKETSDFISNHVCRDWRYSNPNYDVFLIITKYFFYPKPHQLINTVLWQERNGKLDLQNWNINFHCTETQLELICCFAEKYLGNIYSGYVLVWVGLDGHNNCGLRYRTSSLNPSSLISEQ